MRPLTVIRESLSYWRQREKSGSRIAQEHLRLAELAVEKVEVELDQLQRTNASLIALTEAQEERIRSFKAALEWKPPAACKANDLDIDMPCTCGEHHQGGECPRTP